MTTVALISSGARAEVILDGTLNPALEGMIPPTSAPGQYLLGSDLGLELGNQLLFSLYSLGLASGNSLTMSGPANIETILARVTGGDPSFIDGIIRSEIAGADLFLLNPSGIITGPGARLEVDGSVALSTADYLRLGTNGIFHARNPAASVLTMDPPSAFGFLAGSIAAIEVNQSELVVAPSGDATDPRSLSLIGGDIRVVGGGFPDGRLAIVGAPAGRVNLASVASPGLVQLETDGVTIEDGVKRGDISVSNHASITSTGLLPNASIGQVVQKISPPTGDEILIARNGPIYVVLRPTPFAPGEGAIYVRAHDLSLEDADVSATTGTDFNGGDIDIDLTGSLRIREATRDAEVLASSGLVREASFTVVLPGVGEFPVIATYLGTGDAGNIRVKAKNVILEAGGSLDTETITSGSGGSIDVTALYRISIRGVGTRNLESGIFSDAFDTGDAGRIRVTADFLEVSQRGQISVQSRPGSTGDGGDVRIQAGSILLASGAAITARNEGTGNAGSIFIGGIPDDAESSVAGRALDRLELRNASIATESVAAFGGNINIEAETLIALVDSTVSTNVASGKGDGGNIDIDPVFVVINDSQITAQADVGNGGNITIVSNFFINTDSIVDASSQTGIDGAIAIKALDQELSRTVRQLPATVLDASRLLAQRCAARRGQPASFVVTERDGVPSPPDGYRTLTGPLDRDPAEQSQQARLEAQVEVEPWLIGGEVALRWRCSI